jgi:hypothetical protein
MLSLLRLSGCACELEKLVINVVVFKVGHISLVVCKEKQQEKKRKQQAMNKMVCAKEG